jgi:hypothetical protein
VLAVLVLSTSRAMISCIELRRLKCVTEEKSGLMSSKCGRTRSLLTGFQFGGIKLKGCSAGGWRSGMQRSEK